MHECMAGLSHESRTCRSQNNFSGLAFKQQITKNTLKVLIVYYLAVIAPPAGTSRVIRANRTLTLVGEINQNNVRVLP